MYVPVCSVQLVADVGQAAQPTVQGQLAALTPPLKSCSHMNPTHMQFEPSRIQPLFCIEPFAVHSFLSALIFVLVIWFRCEPEGKCRQCIQ